MNHPQFNCEIVEIRDDRIHGASELARRCLAILAEAAKTLPAADCDEFRQRLLTLAAELAVIRPSMAPIGNLLRRWQERVGTANGDLELLRRLAAEHAAALIALSRQAVTDCAAHAARWFGPGRTLMTHSLSSTVLETCRLLRNQDLRMIITESRPLTEGRRMVERLSAWNVPTTYITDAQMGLFVTHADGVLVVFGDEVGIAADRGVHLGTTDFGHCRCATGHRLDYLWSGKEHVRVLTRHDHEVHQRWRVRRTAGAGAADNGDLWHHPRKQDV